jgi:hypothetical protein
MTLIVGPCRHHAECSTQSSWGSQPLQCRALKLHSHPHRLQLGQTPRFILQFQQSLPFPPLPLLLLLPQRPALIQILLSLIAVHLQRRGWRRFPTEWPSMVLHHQLARKRQNRVLLSC